MGCWNETCVLTDLPIEYEEPVVVMMSEREFLCDDRFFFAQLEELKVGTYNDYGWIKERPNPPQERFHLRTFFVKQTCWNRVLEIPLSYREPDPAKRLEELQHFIKLWKMMPEFKANPTMNFAKWKPSNHFPWEDDLTLLDQFCHVALFASQVRRALGPRSHGKHQNLDLESHDKLHSIRAVELQRMLAEEREIA